MDGGKLGPWDQVRTDFVHGSFVDSEVTIEMGMRAGPTEAGKSGNQDNLATLVTDKFNIYLALDGHGVNGMVEPRRFSDHYGAKTEPCALTSQYVAKHMPLMILA